MLPLQLYTKAEVWTTLDIPDIIELTLLLHCVKPFLTIVGLPALF